jgi:CspA family cold shock protein
MPSGRVKFYNPSKNYGFITPDDLATGGQDVFVHLRELKKSGLDCLDKHERVSYDLEEDKGKTRACNIKVLEP